MSSSLECVKVSAEHPRAYLRPLRPPLSDLVRDAGDAAAIVRAHREYAYSTRQIATHLGCSVTTVHRRIRSWEEESTSAREHGGSTRERAATEPRGRVENGTWKT